MPGTNRFYRALMGMKKARPRAALPSRSPRPRSTARRSRPKTIARGRQQRVVSGQAKRARRKFLQVFPKGFRDETYLDWERDYKWDAHRRWESALNRKAFHNLIEESKFAEIAATAIRIESQTNLLFSFEKMALRDAVRGPDGARDFALALYDFLHGTEAMSVRFERWVEAVSHLPRLKTRVLTWPLVTVFGFIAQPRTHFFFKPMVTREAARRYGRELEYAPRPTWTLYKRLLDFVGHVRADIRDLRPRDMIDLQSFLWIQGSDEYPD
jgi:hypothetical protein